MTKDEALLAIQDIRDCRLDDQLAHTKEDSLYEEFIQFVSLQEDEIGEIARLILTTKSINFCRWYD